MGGGKPPKSFIVAPRTFRAHNVRIGAPILLHEVWGIEPLANDVILWKSPSKVAMDAWIRDDN